MGKREKVRQDKNVELGKSAWHFVTSIPYVGDFLNFSDYMLDAIYQTIKGIEENLAKLMKSSYLEYSSHIVYPSPIFNYPDEDTIESAHYDAKEFYEENKKEFNDVDKMINSLEVKTTIEGEEYSYKEIFKKALRHYFEDDKVRMKGKAEREEKKRRERRERDSKSREIEIEAFEDRFTPDNVERDPDHEQIKWDEKYHPLLEANENYFKGFLEGIKDIQKDEKSFNDKNLKEALSEATEKTRLSNTKFREGYLYAVNRNKLNPERLKGKYADGRIEGVNIEQVEEVLRFIEETTSLL
jgi:hypothetical protein